MGFHSFNAADSSGSGLARRFGVGEVADLAAVPQAYQATDSFWMQSNTWMGRNLIPAAARNMLASASGLVALANPVRDAVASNAQWLSASVPPATLPGGITVFQTRADGQVMLIDADGPRMISTGLTGKVAVVSDGTALWAMGTAGAANTAPGIAKSTDGKSWVKQVLSGWPATATMRANLYPFTSPASTGLPSSTAQGYCNAAWDTTNQSAFFWTGARCLAIVDDGSKFMCLRSTNGTAWTDDTTQVLGASIPLAGGTVFFWRNGNNAFLKVGSAYRFSSDGGANWSAVATEPTALAGGFLQRNGSDPARLAASLDYVSLFVSTNSGQTWNNRYAASGLSDFGGGIAYLGSTIVALSSTGILRRSNDDGATWAAVAWPQAALGTPRRVLADGFRFYIITSTGQLLTTLDGNTVLARSGGMPMSLSAAVSLNSSVTLFVEEFVGGSGDAAFTLDGGVTTQRAQMRSGSYGISIGHSNGVAVTAGGKSYFVGGTENVNANQRCYVVDVDDIQAGGALFRSSTATIPPSRTNMAAFVRVL